MGRSFTFRVQSKQAQELSYRDRLNLKGKDFEVLHIDPFGDGLLSQIELKELAYPSPISGENLPQAIERDLLAGENLAQYRVVSRESGSLYLADARSLTRVRAIGITLANASAGGSAAIKYAGYLQNKAWQFDPNKALFLGNQGQIVQVPPPAAAAAVVDLGLVISPSEIIINIGDPIYLN